jgi:hypothetical protein|tara:strand:- start:606 stop:1103 length:498 start_codon:yes stop_codon:yes gene_type:complete
MTIEFRELSVNVNKGTESLDEKYAKSMGYTNCEKAMDKLTPYLDPKSALCKSISASTDNVVPEFKKMQKHMDGINALWESVEKTINEKNFDELPLVTLDEAKSQTWILTEKSLEQMVKLLNPKGALSRTISSGPNNVIKQFTQMSKHMNKIMELWEEVDRLSENP